MNELEIYLLKKDTDYNRELLELIAGNITALKKSCSIRIHLENHVDGKISKSREKILKKKGVTAWPTLINLSTKKMLQDDEDVFKYIRNLIGKAKTQRPEELGDDNFHDMVHEMMTSSKEEDDDEEISKKEYEKNKTRFTSARKVEVDEEIPKGRGKATSKTERTAITDDFDDDALDIMQKLTLNDD